MREHLQRPDFNAIERPADGPGPERWQPMAHNRLAVWQQHRYTYDRFGNTVEKRSGAHERRRLHWNAEHQLSRIEVHTARGVEVWGYDYDPFGRRVAKYRLPADYATRTPAANDDPAPLPGEKRKRAVPLARAAYLARHAPETVHFGWEGNRLLSERRGNRQQLYLYEDDSFVPLMLVRSAVGGVGSTAADGAADADAALNAALDADLDADSLAIKHQHPEHWELLQARRRKLARQLGQTATPPPKPKAEVIHLHTDHLGTPKEATDADGHLVWTADYAAWGKARTTTPPRRILSRQGNTVVETQEAQADPVECNLRFQGQHFDAESGLHYNRFRYYDSDIGRFASQDPIGLAGGENLYQYAQNPVHWIDPLGLKGVYLFETTSGSAYIGKGPYDRYQTSIRQRAPGPGGVSRGVHRNVSSPCKQVSDDDYALMVEHVAMLEYPKIPGAKPTLNKIASPGEKKLSAAKLKLAATCPGLAAAVAKDATSLVSALFAKPIGSGP